MYKLSIVIPFGTSAERDFIDGRVAAKSRLYRNFPDVEFIFVEGYSSRPNPELRRRIEADGHRYYLDESQTRFSQGMCRNLGVVMANAPMCTFLDVDYHMSPAMLERVMAKARDRQIAENPNRFLVLPCVFLTEEGNAILFDNPEESWDELVLDDLVSGAKRLVRFFAPASSAMVVNRHKFLEMGGNDNSYIGHGYEDFDLQMRLLKISGSFECLPQDMGYDARSWNFRDYRGFRALLALPGYESFFRGMFTYHLYHPEPNNNGYLDNREINHQRFYKVLATFNAIGDGPDPLPDKSAIDKKALVFTLENGSCYRSLRGIVPHVGQLVCKKEEDFFEDEKYQPQKLEKYLRDNGISTIIFPNPYGNERRLQIYAHARKAKIPYICYDRGALPDAWFFDSGFNYDSPSYSAKCWDRELSATERDYVENYIHNLKNSENYLEKQGAREAPEFMKRKLGIRNKKVVFIPFQVSEDTVIKYFTEPPFDYYGFARIADSLAARLAAEDWVFVAKKHPLQVDFKKEDYPNLIFAPDDANISSLLEMSDLVLTINSGVGVYVMIYEKPCIVAGNAFYQFDSLNQRARSEAELEKMIRRGTFPFEREKMLRFVHYLLRDLYSFGKSSYRINDKGNRVIRSVNYIDFYRIVINGQKYLEAASVEPYEYKMDSLAYLPFNVKPQAMAEADWRRDGSLRKSVLIITDIRFWLCSSGDQLRLDSLCKQLQTVYDVSVFFLDSLDAESRRLAQSRGCSVTSYLDYVKKGARAPASPSPMPAALKAWQKEPYAAALAAFLNSRPQFGAVIFESIKYAWLEGLFPYQVLKIIDAQDVVSLRRAQGMPAITKNLGIKEETEIFNSVDAVMFLQKEDYEAASASGCEAIAVICPHGATPEEAGQPPEGIHFGIISGGGEASIAAVDWFVKNVWSMLSGQDATLHIFGGICRQLRQLPPNVELHGIVADADEAYSQCQVLAHPAIGGSDVKIKVADALAHGKPALAFAQAIDWQDPEACGIAAAKNRSEYINAFLRLSYDEAYRRMLAQNALKAAKEKLEPKKTFEQLLKLIGSY